MSKVEMIDAEVTMDEFEEEFVETKPKRFLFKVKNILKKHGKKIVAGAAVTTAGLIGYSLGSKSKGGDDDIESSDIYELEDHSALSEVTED